MKRKLAPEALYSSKTYNSQAERHLSSQRTVSPCHIEGMEKVTAKHINKVDPGGHRARALLKKIYRKT